MPSPPPTTAELEATVQRMETRLGAVSDPRIRDLMSAYARLSQRFASDLSDPREILLSKGAAPMLIQEVASRMTSAK